MAAGRDKGDDYMATFTVNGQSVTVEKNQKLIRYLRDTLHLTSVKDGCSEGACGTCHVLIDDQHHHSNNSNDCNHYHNHSGSCKG